MPKEKDLTDSEDVSEELYVSVKKPSNERKAKKEIANVLFGTSPLRDSEVDGALRKFRAIKHARKKEWVSLVKGNLGEEENFLLLHPTRVVSYHKSLYDVCVSIGVANVFQLTEVFIKGCRELTAEDLVRFGAIMCLLANDRKETFQKLKEENIELRLWYYLFNFMSSYVPLDNPLDVFAGLSYLGVSFKETPLLNNVRSVLMRRVFERLALEEANEVSKVLVFQQPPTFLTENIMTVIRNYPYLYVSLNERLFDVGFGDVLGNSYPVELRIMACKVIVQADKGVRVLPRWRSLDNRNLQSCLANGFKGTVLGKILAGIKAIPSQELATWHVSYMASYVSFAEFPRDVPLGRNHVKVYFYNLLERPIRTKDMGALLTVAATAYTAYKAISPGIPPWEILSLVRFNAILAWWEEYYGAAGNDEWREQTGDLMAKACAALFRAKEVDLNDKKITNGELATKVADALVGSARYLGAKQGVLGKIPIHLDEYAATFMQ